MTELKCPSCSIALVKQNGDWKCPTCKFIATERMVAMIERFIGKKKSDDSNI